VRKDVKKAAEHIGVAIGYMEKVSKDKKVPDQIKERLCKIISNSSVNKDELVEIKDMYLS
jgi:predicted HAD superfamily phosphohydrolase